MTGIKLEPCPFCGAHLEQSEYFSTARRTIYVHSKPAADMGWCPCDDVRIDAPSADIWNRRAVSEHVEPAPEAGVVGVPADGWKLVPIEPTEDMCNAGYGYLPVSPGGRRNAERWVYSAMLAASPPAPSDPVVQKLVEALKPFADVFENDVGSDESDDDMFRPMRVVNRAPFLRIGDLRRAAEAYRAALALVREVG